MATIPEAVDLRPGLLGSVLHWLRKALAALGRWLRKVLAFLGQDKARVWLQRKAVGAWMNILIAVAAGVTTTTAGLLAEKHWPPTQTWDVGSLKLFALWCLSFPAWVALRTVHRDASEGAME